MTTKNQSLRSGPNQQHRVISSILCQFPPPPCCCCCSCPVVLLLLLLSCGWLLLLLMMLLLPITDDGDSGDSAGIND